MASFTTSNKKNAAKPDMTPLVDLGFLLITFFIYTSTFTKPVQFSYNQPLKDGETSAIYDSNTLTLIIGKNDEIFYHRDNQDELTNLNSVEDSKTGLRNLLTQSKMQAKEADNFTVIIKPSDLSTYNRFIDILDEMIIVNQDRYAVVDITEKEKSLL